MSATDHRGRRRVAVTGLGVKTPAGTDLDTFWSTLVAGKSTAAGIKRYDPSDLPVRFGCEISDFDPTEYLGAKEALDYGEGLRDAFVPIFPPSPLRLHLFSPGLT